MTRTRLARLLVAFAFGLFVAGCAAASTPTDPGAAPTSGGFIEAVAAAASNIIGNATLIAIYAVSVLDFLLGTLKALSKKDPVTGQSEFNWKWVDAWVGDHLTKAVMITLALVFGILVPPITIGDISLNIVGITAEAAAVTYVAKTLASALLNLNFSSPDQAPASISPPA